MTICAGASSNATSAVLLPIPIAPEPGVPGGKKTIETIVFGTPSGVPITCAPVDGVVETLTAVTSSGDDEPTSAQLGVGPLGPLIVPGFVKPGIVASIVPVAGFTTDTVPLPLGLPLMLMLLDTSMSLPTPSRLNPRGFVKPVKLAPESDGAPSLIVYCLSVLPPRVRKR